MNLLKRIHWFLIGKRKFHYVGYIKAQTTFVDEKGEETRVVGEHNYSLFENGIEKRKVEINSIYESSAKNHPIYSNLVIPWINGHQTYEFAQFFVPKHQTKDNTTHLTVIK